MSLTHANAGSGSSDFIEEHDQGTCFMRGILVGSALTAGLWLAIGYAVC